MVAHLGELTDVRGEGVRHRWGNSPIRSFSTIGSVGAAKSLRVAKPAFLTTAGRAAILKNALFPYVP